MRRTLITSVALLALTAIVNAHVTFVRQESVLSESLPAKSAPDDPLKLTVEQEQKLAQVVQTELTELKKVAEDESLSSTEKALRSKELVQAAKIEGTKVLSLDQVKILAQLKAKHLAQIQSQMEGRPADVFVQQIVTEDDHQVFPWLRANVVGRR